MKKNFLIALAFGLAIAPVSSYAQQWKQMNPPNTSTVENWARGISGTSANDVWAVGHAQTNTAPLSDYTSVNTIMHWNGTSWTSFPVSNLGSNINEFWSVAAVNSNLAWAVGDYTLGTNMQIAKWNGTSWTQQSLGYVADETTLHSVWALSATDAWAVGTRSNNTPASVVSGCLIMHYNGSSWNVLTAPAVGSFRNRFNAVHGIAANDVWAAGTWGNTYGDFHGLVMHWNGSAWSNSPLTPSFSELWDIKAVAANDVWAIGDKTVGGAFSTLHWNGSSWTEFALPGEDSNVFTVALAVKPNHDVYAFGNHIHKWNGSAWVIVDSLTRIPYANVKAATVLPTTGEIWASGRWFDLSVNYYKYLVLRQDTATTSTGGGTGGGTTGLGTLSTHIQTVQVSPNPFHKDLRVAVTTNTAEAAVISLRDASGRLILQQSRSLTSGENIIQVSVPGSASKGMYVLEVRTSSETKQITLMKD